MARNIATSTIVRLQPGTNPACWKINKFQTATVLLNKALGSFLGFFRRSEIVRLTSLKEANMQAGCKNNDKSDVSPGNANNN